MATDDGNKKENVDSVNESATIVESTENLSVRLTKLDTQPLGSLSKDEQNLLYLHDQLQELRLERTLLEVQCHHSEDMDLMAEEDEIEAHVKKLEQECLEARSLYYLRNSILQNVLIANPTLKAVHSSINANSAEKALHPLLDRQDVLSMAHSNLSTKLRSIHDALSEAEVENLIHQRRNKILADSLLALTDKLQEPRIEDIEDPSSRKLLEQLRSDTKESRKKWKVMKSVVTAVIASSGVDWAHDDGLRDIVLYDES